MALLLVWASQCMMLKHESKSASASASAPHSMPYGCLFGQGCVDGKGQESVWPVPSPGSGGLLLSGVGRVGLSINDATNAADRGTYTAEESGIASDKGHCQNYLRAPAFELGAPDWSGSQGRSTGFQFGLLSFNVSFNSLVGGG